MRSLRSRLVAASVLWTGGLLFLMHIASMLLLHVFPALRGHHSLAASFAGVAAMAAGAMLARGGLQPFAQLRQELSLLRTGQIRRTGANYPIELQPLVDELNQLLEARDKTADRARATAGSLAHALKTPLALLALEAERLRHDGNAPAAAALELQIEKMSSQVNFHLVRASASSGAGQLVPAREACEAMARAMRVLHAGRRLEITVAAEPGIALFIQPEDLDEILGNVLDNACKWAGSKVSINVSAEAGVIQFLIDDDGPGIAPEMRATVLRRGVRADETTPGSGLGLAIVSELCELRGGTVQLEDSPLSGLRVRLEIPAHGRPR